MAKTRPVSVLFDLDLDVPRRNPERSGAPRAATGHRCRADSLERPCRHTATDRCSRLEHRRPVPAGQACSGPDPTPAEEREHPRLRYRLAVDAVSSLETALGAELLRAELLGAPRPRIAERYIVERFLGRGATGVVVAAMDERLGRPVALKLSIAATDAANLEEARALAKLDHPNVVRVLDADVTDAKIDGTEFRLRVISMQLVAGVSLRAWLREKTRTPEEIVAVFIGAGSGLAAAHAQSIIHRDFKPENVIVGAGGIAQVIDFGFAIPAESSRSDTPADIAGTDPYLAPEARVGRPTHLSDQFAFAVSIVDALTGGATPANAQPPEIDTRLWAILRRASHRDGEQRYPNMQSLVDALARLTRPSWPGPALVAGLVIAVAVVVAGLSSGTSSGANRDDAATVPCAALPSVFHFRSQILPGEPTELHAEAWGVYEVRRTGGQGCDVVAVIERLCDSGEDDRIVVYRPGHFQGAWSGRAVAEPPGGLRIMLANVEIGRRRPRHDRERTRFRHSFDVHLETDGWHGTGQVTDTSGQNPPYRLIVEPVSRSACVAGRDARSP